LNDQLLSIHALLPFFIPLFKELKFGDAIICRQRHGALQAFTPAALCADNLLIRLFEFLKNNSSPCG
jgi:hypothetical protein